jgi:hypothetical protein
MATSKVTVIWNESRTEKRKQQFIIPFFSGVQEMELYLNKELITEIRKTSEHDPEIFRYVVTEIMEAQRYTDYKGRYILTENFQEIIKAVLQVYRHSEILGYEQYNYLFDRKVLVSKSFNNWLNNLTRYNDLLLEFEMSSPRFKEEITRNIYNNAVSKIKDKLEYGKYRDQLSVRPDFYYKSTHRIFYAQTTPEMEQLYISLISKMQEVSSKCKELNKRYVFNDANNKRMARIRMTGNSPQVSNAFFPILEMSEKKFMRVTVRVDLATLVSCNTNEIIDLSNICEEPVQLKYIAVPTVVKNYTEKLAYESFIKNMVNNNVRFNLKNVNVNYQLKNAVAYTDLVNQPDMIEYYFGLTKYEMLS